MRLHVKQDLIDFVDASPVFNHSLAGLRSAARIKKIIDETSNGGELQLESPDYEYFYSACCEHIVKKVMES